jgi:CheY-like chemotaxis protein
MAEWTKSETADVTADVMTDVTLAAIRGLRPRPTQRAYASEGSGMDEAVPTVLVVEDDAMVRRILVRALILRGLCVRDFESGPEALAYAAESTDTVRLLVTDVVMPRMNGFEVTSALRRRWPALPTLIVSASHELSDGAIPEAGPTRFLAKPFTYVQLIAEVDVLLAEPEGS